MRQTGALFERRVWFIAAVLSEGEFAQLQEDE